MIKERGDCADFMFRTVTRFLARKKGQLPEKLRIKPESWRYIFAIGLMSLETMSCGTLVKITPLLFHACQYFAGCLLPEETFVTSGRQGSQQYELGKQRLLAVV